MIRYQVNFYRKLKAYKQGLHRRSPDWHQSNHFGLYVELTNPAEQEHVNSDLLISESSVILKRESLKAHATHAKLFLVYDNIMWSECEVDVDVDVV